MSHLVLHFELTILPETMNKLLRMHWRARQKMNQEIYHLVSLATAGRRPKVPLEQARIVCTRFSSIEPDYDGCVGSFKAVLDGLVASKVIADDKVTNIGKTEYRWEKAPPKKGRIRVEVYEIPTDGDTNEK